MALLLFLPKIFTSVFLLIVILMATGTPNRKIGDIACHCLPPSTPLRIFRKVFVVVLFDHHFEWKVMMAIWWVEVMSGTYPEIQFCTLETPIASLLKNIYTLARLYKDTNIYFRPTNH